MRRSFYHNIFTNGSIKMNNRHYTYVKNDKCNNIDDKKNLCKICMSPIAFDNGSIKKQHYVNFKKDIDDAYDELYDY